MSLQPYWSCDGCLPGRQGRCVNLPAAFAMCSHPRANRTTNADNISTSQQQQQQSATVPLPPPSTGTAGVCSQLLASLPAVYTLPSLHSILSVRVPTLHHVPKGARDVWARLVGGLLSSLASDPADVDSWSKFFMLAKCVLVNPPRVGGYHWQDTLSSVGARIKRWRDEDIVGLWSEVLEEERRLTQRRRPKKENSELLLASTPAVP